MSRPGSQLIVHHEPSNKQEGISVVKIIIINPVEKFRMLRKKPFRPYFRRSYDDLPLPLGIGLYIWR